MYKYPIEKCDVLDKENLNRFRDKRAEWISWLLGNDAHSIWRQISSLLWDNTLFMTINDLRRLAAERPDESVGFNSAVMRMFDAGFIATQVTAIRRLTDKQPQGPDKGVISLRRLVEDIKSNRDFITREIHVAFDGLPYDYASIRDAWIEKRVSQKKASATFEWMPTAGSEAWSMAELAHKNFDRLSGCSNPESRSRNDLIASKVFDLLIDRLDTCQDVRKYTDKFVAHAAEPASRVNLTDTQTTVTLNRLKACNMAIYQVADFVFGPLLWEGSYGSVPMPQYNHLENLEKGWIAKENSSRANELWRLHEKSNQWTSESLWPD